MKTVFILLVSCMKIVYLSFGFIFLALGILGIIMPGLPGFPFLLLTIFCFSRSSERVHNWFLQTEIYQKHVLPFNENRGMRKKTKYNILIFATIMMAIAFYFTPSAVGKSIILVALVIKYWYFLFKIKNLKT